MLSVDLAAKASLSAAWLARALQPLRKAWRLRVRDRWGLYRDLLVLCVSLIVVASTSPIVSHDIEYWQADSIGESGLGRDVGDLAFFPCAAGNEVDRVRELIAPDAMCAESAATAPDLDDSWAWVEFTGELEALVNATSTAPIPFTVRTNAQDPTSRYYNDHYDQWTWLLLEEGQVSIPFGYFGGSTSKSLIRDWEGSLWLQSSVEQSVIRLRSSSNFNGTAFETVELPVPPHTESEVSPSRMVYITLSLLIVVGLVMQSTLLLLLQEAAPKAQWGLDGTSLFSRLCYWGAWWVFTFLQLCVCSAALCLGVYASGNLGSMAVQLLAVLLMLNAMAAATAVVMGGHWLALAGPTMGSWALLVLWLVAAFPGLLAQSAMGNSSAHDGYPFLGSLLPPPSAFAMGFAEIFVSQAHANAVTWSTVADGSVFSFALPLSASFYSLLIFASAGVCLLLIVWLVRAPVWRPCACQLPGEVAPLLQQQEEEQHEDHSASPLSVIGLSKTFRSSRRTTHAVVSLDLELQRGEIFALIGHNGAGKTTTVSMVAGQLKPTTGSVVVNGNDMHRGDERERAAARRAIGICPQQSVLWERFTVWEHLQLIANVKGAPEGNLTMVLDQVGLLGAIDTPASQLNTTQRRQLSLGMALVNDPAILIVDEPTADLDPSAQRQMWQLFESVKASRVVLLVTQSMNEAELMGDRVAVLSNGKLVVTGTMEHLRQQFRTRYLLDVEGGDDSKTRADIVFGAIPAASTAKSTAASATFELPLESAVDIPELLRALERNEARARLSLSSMEEVFVSVMEREEDAASEVEMRPVDSRWSSHGERAPRDADAAAVLSWYTQLCILLRQGFRAPVSRCDLLTLAATIALLASAAVLLASVMDIKGDQTRSVYDGTLGVSIATADTGGTPFEVTVAPFSPSVDGLVWVGGIPGLEVDTEAVVAAINDWGLYSAEVATNVLNAREFTDFLSTSTNRQGTVVGAVWLDEGFATLLFDGSLLTLPPTLLALVNSAQLQASSSQPLFAPTSVVSACCAAELTFIVDNAVLYLTVITFVILLLTLFFGFAFLISAFSAQVTEERVGRAMAMLRLCRVSPLVFWSSRICHSSLLGPMVTFITAWEIGSQALASTTYNGSGTITACCVVLSVGMQLSLASFVFRSRNRARLGMSLLLCVGVPSFILYTFTIGRICKNGNFALYEPSFRCGKYSTATSMGFTWLVQLVVPIMSLPLAKGEQRFGVRPYSLEYAAVILSIYVLVLWWLERPTAREAQSTSAAIEVRDVCNSAAGAELHDITFRVAHGECVALVATGGGKGALMDILAEHSQPHSGCVIFDEPDAVVGYCPQNDALFASWTVREHLETYGRLRGLSPSQLAVEVEELMTALGLQSHAAALPAVLSGGTQRKLSLAVALIASPPVVLLDEPTRGLDPTARRAAWGLIEELSGRSAVVIATVAMDEVEKLCDRVVFLAHGATVAEGTPMELQQRHAPGLMATFTLASPRPEEESPLRRFVSEALCDGAAVGEELELVRGQDVHFTLPQARLPLADAFEAVERQREDLGLEKYVLWQPTLEDVFVRLSSE